MVNYVFLRNSKADSSFLLLVAIENKVKELVKDMLAFATDNQGQPEIVEQRIKESMTTLACTILMELGYHVDIDEDVNITAKR